MTLQIAFLIGKWSEENFCTGDCQRDSPLTKLLPTILAQPSLPRQRCYNVGNKKHTLQHYFVLYTYPHVYTLTHSKEWGSTSYSTQPKPGHQFWSFIRTQSRAFVYVSSPATAAALQWQNWIIARDQMSGKAWNILSTVPLGTNLLSHALHTARGPRGQGPCQELVLLSQEPLAPGKRQLT